MQETVQARLRRLREESGLSQEKLAAELGVTRMTLAGYELGKRPPDSAFLSKVCSYFNCTPDYVFGVSPFKNNEEYDAWVSSSSTLQDGLNKLPAGKRGALITVFNWLLQDNDALNQLTTDEHYLINRFINLILAYIDLYKKFTETVRGSDVPAGVEEAEIFRFYKAMEQDKQTLYHNIETTCSDLFGYLMRHAKHGR